MSRRRHQSRRRVSRGGRVQAVFGTSAALALALVSLACAPKEEAKSPSGAGVDAGQSADPSAEGGGVEGEASAAASKKPGSLEKTKSRRDAGGAETPADPGNDAAGEATAAPPAPTPEAPQAAPRPEMSGSARSAYDAGKAAFAAGDLAGAEKQFGKAASADKKNAYEAYYSLGVVHERFNRTAKAQAAYRASLAIVPGYEPALTALALSMASAGDPDGAFALLQSKQADTSDRAAILTAMAEVKSIKGESGEAQRLAQEALKANPNYKPAMLALARDHYRARRIDLALYSLTGILDGYGPDNPPRDPKSGEARLLRGMIYTDRGLRGPAMEELTKATAARPDLVDAHLLLATAMLESGNAAGAAPHLEMAIRYDNSNAIAHLQLGDAYRLLDRTADARRELEWVVKAAPNLVAAHYNLGLLFLLSARVPGLTPVAASELAIKHLEAYKAKAPRSGPDDVDELITRAKTKKALLEAQAKEGGGA